MNGLCYNMENVYIKRKKFLEICIKLLVLCMEDIKVQIYNINMEHNMKGEERI